VRQDNCGKVTWWMGAAAALSLLLCCAMPLIVATFGLAAITATVKYGMAGLLAAGLLGVGLYLLRAAGRRRQSGLAGPHPMSTLIAARRSRRPGERG